MDSLTTLLPQFLTKLEQIESRLLSWGMVDGSFSDDEVIDLADDFLDAHDTCTELESGDELVDLLEERRLLFQFQQAGETRLRTRMAESVRLLARLRQLFPQHLATLRRWQIASTLVADYRLILRPRQFPYRNVEFSRVVEEVDEIATLDATQSAVLDAMLNSGVDNPFRLADFQLRATRSVLAGANSPRESGTIVCAGTGSGKTLSFYLPAFLNIAATLDESRWTRCLAIYPRNELLKDQFSETYRQARKIDSALLANGKRKLVIGTLFGATPTTGRYFNRDNPPRGWVTTNGGFICPYMGCPSDSCDGPMVWRDTDRQANVERLVCRECNKATEPDELILTREKLRAEPPDILFTTTEMLNQRMGDSQIGRLFGINTAAQQKPSMVLLDEVHTYSGITGAQVANLLRRWQKASGAKPHFVGLSATLSDAKRFFAQLTGVPDFRVEEVSPHSSEMERRGMEYMLALRGDPASGASLLSTTIQTAMLMRRVQDTAQDRYSQGLYGTREFIFTDDLDVTNRLFFNLRDAEGQDSWGRHDVEKPEGSLANLRDSGRPESDLRFRFGQSWKLCEDIGHELNTNTQLRINRTSSQDVGVGANSDIIVATASLEVGFNDPEVNVVVQHKAPRDVAQFLQRKGRAGRRPEMRPWTVVVLSDYARDRVAWQSYDLLFDPELPPRELPTSNRYVLRMQAVYAFQDWMAFRLRRTSGVPGGSVWRDFSAPPRELGSSYASTAQERQKAAARIIEGLLTSDTGLEDLRSYLQSALQQPAEVIDMLLWEPPRALMTSVLPTLLRRLNTGWRLANPPSGCQQYDYMVSNNPLPEFVPATLFSDLNLPEVTVVTAQQQNDDETPSQLPLLQALREFAPGRVSRRFGISHQYARHWTALPDLVDEPQKLMPIGNWLSQYEELGEFQFVEDGELKSVRCVRPFKVRPVRPPSHLADSSNSFLRWQTQIVPAFKGMEGTLPSQYRWESIVEGICFYTHNANCQVEVRRFAKTADASIATQTGQQFETRVDFVDEVPDPDGENTGHTPSPVAVGFAIEVDGVAFRIRVPDDLQIGGDENNTKLRCLRTAYFRDQILADPSLDGVANWFQRQRLADIYCSALIHAAVVADVSLFDVWDNQGETNDTPLDFHTVLSVIFQSISASQDSGGEDGNAPTPGADQEIYQRLFHDLAELLTNPTVLNALHQHAPVLWQVPDDSWRPWLKRKFKTTFGSAVMEAVQQLCPDLDAGDLTLDIDCGPRPDGAPPAPDKVEEVWLLEKAVGGGGVVEAFLARYGEDPRRFFDLVEAALNPSDFEVVDDQLTTLLEWANDAGDASVSDLFSELRNAQSVSHQAQADSFERLISQLSRRGLFVCHSVVAAVAARILKPGSTSATDELLHELICDWQQLERRLGVDIDLRIIAYMNSGSDRLDKSLAEVVGDAVGLDPRQWRFGALSSMLWPRGNAIRGRKLDTYNPFAKLPDADHELLRDCLSNGPTTVRLSDDDWREQVAECLVSENAVRLEGSTEELTAIRGAILELMATPVDAGLLLLHPRVRSITRQNGSVALVLELAEVVQ